MSKRKTHKTQPKPKPNAELDELKQELSRLQGHFAPPSPNDIAEVLAELDDWQERWFSLQDERLAFSPELDAFRRQTLYFAKHAEKLGLDSTPLVVFANELRFAYFELRNDLPPMSDASVFLERLRLKLEPWDDNSTPRPPAKPRAEAEVIVRDYLKARPNAGIAETAAATKCGSVSFIHSLDAWQTHIKKKKYGKASPKRERQLSDKTLAVAKNKTASPADQAEARDLAERRYLELASEDEKATYFDLPPAGRHELIALWIEQQLDAEA